MIYELIIIFLALGGLFLCIKIYKEKQKAKPLVCFVGADCEKVVRGQFSSFLGIGLEVFGGLYYLFIIIYYLILMNFDFSSKEIFHLILILSSGMAFLFSLFLTFIQAFIIKSWCSWCLISALLTTLIFILGSIIFF